MRPIRGMTVLIPKSAMLGEPSVGTLVKQGNETYKVNEVGGRDRHEVAWRLGCVEPIRGAWCLAENGCAAQDEGGDRCAAEEAGGGAAGDAGHDGDGNPAGGEGVREDGDRDHASGQRGHDGCGREEAREESVCRDLMRVFQPVRMKGKRVVPHLFGEKNPEGIKRQPPYTVPTTETHSDLIVIYNQRRQRRTMGR
ncbi:hypothetical protein [Verrucomicrobium spinosum]|uniref:hypothetical protein n=1 Tax=Verrucomicrobium spinosum TaxID=2736 RepID=UPI0012E300F9|nr:hypothetical protein [Verrucomicrobium spinosum]